ncbi:MAG: hypothetical protein JWO81_561 [Alphaproteobacteria bacterium]|nr:hypothetical protein [Alphaproteobacteria bacterium]
MTRMFAAPSSLLGAGLAAALSLAAPAPPPSHPSHDEALSRWLMIHPNRERLRVTHWPAAEPRGERIA